MDLLARIVVTVTRRTSRARMSQAAWREYLESVPLTDNQRSRIVCHLDRLGVHDRAERLRITATLAGVGSLDSTKHLTQGQAGRVVRLLGDYRNRADLDELIPEREPDAPRSAVTWADVSAAFVQAIKLIERPALAFTGSDDAPS